LIVRPVLFATPVLALENRGSAHRRRIISTVRVKGNKAGVVDRLKMGVICEPDTSCKVGVEECRPVLAWVLFLQGGLGLGE
jgi:hypothetical protein